jgi:hypothetical protein
MQEEIEKEPEDIKKKSIRVLYVRIRKKREDLY